MHCGGQASTADRTPVPLQSRPRRSSKNLSSGAVLRIPPSVVLKQKNKATYIEHPSDVPRCPRGLVPVGSGHFNAAALKLGSCSKIPDHAVLKCSSHIKAMSTMGATTQFRSGSANTGVLTGGDVRHACIQQPLNQTPYRATGRPATMLGLHNQTPQRCALYQHVQLQKPEAAVPHIRADDGYEGERCILSKPSGNSEAAFPIALSRVVPEAIGALKLQLGGHSACMRGGGRTSILSSGSTCSSISSRRRPWG